MGDHPSYEELELVRVWFSLILKEDFSRLTVVPDREAMMLVRASTVALSYEPPPVYDDLPQYEQVEYCVQW